MKIIAQHSVVTVDAKTKEQTHNLPGTLLDLPNDEARRLIDLGAAREPKPAEGAVSMGGVGDKLASAAGDPATGTK